MSKQLDRLTKNLGRAYDAFKAAEKKLGTSKSPGIKQEFFSEAAKAASSTLAQKTVVVVAEGVNEALEEAQRRNPRWDALTAQESEDGYHVLLRENPDYKPFVYVNRADERVWTKQVVDGSPTLDEEALQEADPDLWERITVPKRELRPLDELDPNDLASLEDFIYPGKPVIKLAAPRKAKPEELDEDDDE